MTLFPAQSDLIKTHLVPQVANSVLLATIALQQVYKPPLAHAMQDTYVSKDLQFRIQLMGSRATFAQLEATVFLAQHMHFSVKKELFST